VIVTPGLRKLGLSAHVASSVGWLGAVAVSLALAVIGITSQDPQLVRSVYLTLEPVGWFVLVPLSIASLLTGLVQSFGTRWGLFRHYWILTKLVITVLATAVLLMYMQTLGNLADLASDVGNTTKIANVKSPSAVLHAGAAVLLLLTATALSIYKPRGLTPHGQRSQETLDEARQLG